jgi:hypothetical protein
MSAIIDRFKYMRRVEAFAAVVLPALFLWDWNKSGLPFDWKLRMAAMALVSYLLLQGAWYWHLKIKAFEKRESLPVYFHPLYQRFKWSNIGLLGAMLVVLVMAAVGGAARADLYWTAGLLGFAVLEQINYFHYQLMYDTRGAFASLRRNGRLRTPALVIDLARTGSAAQA